MPLHDKAVLHGGNTIFQYRLADNIYRKTVQFADTGVQSARCGALSNFLQPCCWLFPPGLIPFQLPDSTSAVNLLDKPHKIVIFIDSAECNDCRIRMIKQGWGPFLKEIQEHDLSCIIIFNTSQSQSIQNAMENMYLSRPYFLDTEAQFPKLDKQIRLNLNFKTSLTCHNKDMVAGDPSANPGLKNYICPRWRRVRQSDQIFYLTNRYKIVTSPK